MRVFMNPQKALIAICCITLSCLALALTAANAETIKVPVGQQGDQTEIQKPSLGSTMEAVKSKYGNAVTQSPPRGEPPITRWEYNDFVVYFENDVVIHSVTKHKRKD